MADTGIKITEMLQGKNIYVNIYISECSSTSGYISELMQINVILNLNYFQKYFKRMFTLKECKNYKCFFSDEI